MAQTGLDLRILLALSFISHSRLLECAITSKLYLKTNQKPKKSKLLFRLFPTCFTIFRSQVVYVSRNDSPDSAPTELLVVR